MFQHLEDRLKGAQLIHLSRRQQNELPVVKFWKSNEKYLQIISFNLLKPNDIYICRTAALTSRRYILNIYSRNIHTEYFKHAA